MKSATSAVGMFAFSGMKSLNLWNFKDFGDQMTRKSIDWSYAFAMLGHSNSNGILKLDSGTTDADKKTYFYGTFNGMFCGLCTAYASINFENCTFIADGSCDKMFGDWYGPVTVLDLSGSNFDFVH